MSKESAEQIEVTAGDWLARRDAGDWSAGERESFDAWMNEAPAHRIAYWRLESAWNEALRLSALGAGIQSGAPPPPGAWNLSPFFEHASPSMSHSARSGERVGRRVVLRAMAASAVLAVSSLSAWYWWPAGSRYETPVGAVTSLPMSDGSKIILNTDSEIKVAMDDRQRRVELRRGEAFFDVARDPARPFRVAVGEKEIVAVGTKFSVRRENDDVQVVVTEGAVRIEPSGTASAAKVLTAGSIAKSGGHELQVRQAELLEAEEQLAWRSGSLVFRDIPLSEAVAEFNRYNERKIVIEDPAAAALMIGGVVRTTNVDAFVQMLEEGYPVRATFHQYRIVLTSR